MKLAAAGVHGIGPDRIPEVVFSVDHVCGVEVVAGGDSHHGHALGCKQLAKIHGVLLQGSNRSAQTSSVQDRSFQTVRHGEIRGAVCLGKGSGS